MPKDELTIVMAREEENDGISNTIEKKYRGTAADHHDMVVLGKTQVLRRNFKFSTMLGFASTVNAAWETMAIIAVFALTDGGTAVLFWSILAGTIGMSFVYASLAEMSSMCPTAGGQYHWVSELAPPRIQKQLSYVVGWLCAMGWQAFLGGSCFINGTIIQALISLNAEDYVWHNYHGTLLAIAIALFSIVFNSVFAVRLPFIEGCLLILHIVGLFAVVIPLWIMAPRGNVHDVLFTFTNNGNWPTTGLACMIGGVSQIGFMTGYDCSVHMSEEIKDAGRVVPKSLMLSAVPNALMALLMATTFAFCLGDVKSVLATKTHEPFIQVIFNATQSHAGTSIMVGIILVMGISSAVSQVATASRQLWSFSRDHGLPASSWLSYVSPGWNLPLRAVGVSITITILLTLINIGSSVALNAIGSLGAVSIYFSYYISIGCMIWRRLYGEPLPARRWSLGRYGLLINIIAILFLTPVFFFTVWPLIRPVTAENFNWSPVIFCGVLLIAAIHYAVKARHVYTGPVVLVKRDE